MPKWITSVMVGILFVALVSMGCYAILQWWKSGNPFDGEPQPTAGVTHYLLVAAIIALLLLYGSRAPRH